MNVHRFSRIAIFIVVSSSLACGSCSLDSFGLSSFFGGEKDEEDEAERGNPYEEESNDDGGQGEDSPPDDPGGDPTAPQEPSDPEPPSDPDDPISDDPATGGGAFDDPNDPQNDFLPFDDSYKDPNTGFPVGTRYIYNGELFEVEQAWAASPPKKNAWGWKYIESVGKPPEIKGTLLYQGVPVSSINADGSYPEITLDLSTTVADSQITSVVAHVILDATTSKIYEGNGAILTYTLRRTGEFTFRVTLTTAYGKSATEEFSLKVTGTVPNTKPQAVLSVKSQRGSLIDGRNYKLKLPTTITLDGSLSTDSNGDELTQYTFQINGNPTQTNHSQLSMDIASPGEYTLSLTVRDERGADSPIEKIVITIQEDTSIAFTDRVFATYWDGTWQDVALSEIPDIYNVVYICFGIPNDDGSFAGVTEDGSKIVNPAKSDIAMLQSRGKKVILSLGGAAARVEIDTPAKSDLFAQGLISFVEEYGYDGIDLDIEHGVTVNNNVSIYLAQSMKTVTAHFGKGFILTMAPEVAYVQGGYDTYSEGAIFGAYLPMIETLREELTYIHVQYYNDTFRYTPYGKGEESTGEYIYYLTKMLVEGFDLGGSTGERFEGLRLDQVAFGVAATPNSAGRGIFNSTNDWGEIKRGLKLLDDDYGDQGGIRGMMNWSSHWDKSYHDWKFADTVGSYMFDILGGTP